MAVKEFQKSYMGTRGEDSAEFRFDLSLNEWTHGECSLVRRNGWHMRRADHVIPCEGNTCGEWTFPDLHQAPAGATARSGKARKPHKTQSRARVENVGACLSKRIAGFMAIKESGGCNCRSYARKMDSWGPDGCEQRRGEIVEHLIGNQEIMAAAIADAGVPGCGLLSKLAGTAAAVPLLRLGAGWLLTKAIEDAKKNIAEQRMHPAGRVFANPKLPPPDPFPFTGPPKLTLISHFWPRKGTWEYHAERLAAISDQFERKVMGIATGKGTENLDTFKAAFPGWEFFEVANDPKQREVLTYRRLMSMVATDDPDAVIFCHHGKGAQDHTIGNDAVRWWIDSMYDTVLCNPGEVIQAMADGASVVGSLRRHGKMLGARHGWHYSGTYYAFRAARAFPMDSFPLRGTWWATESWPGDYFPLAHSHCLFGDDAGDLYKPDQQPRAELELWKAARCS